jgi:hypothetical protein
MKNLLTLVFLSFCLFSFSQSKGGIDRRTERVRDQIRKISEDAAKGTKSTSSSGNATNNFNYVFKNGKPYGTNVIVKYDGFYRNYTISFTKQNGETSGCTINENNFIEHWKFKYNKSIYKLTN